MVHDIYEGEEARGGSCQLLKFPMMALQVLIRAGLKVVFHSVQDWLHSYSNHCKVEDFEVFRNFIRNQEDLVSPIANLIQLKLELQDYHLILWFFELDSH